MKYSEQIRLDLNITRGSDQGFPHDKRSAKIIYIKNSNKLLHLYILLCLPTTSKTIFM